ncbi:MAG: alkaline phosphatase family protein [Actinomycetota bacterium]|nr:alkaline phosphatase family protein [Actinomycetota bacterium]
MITRRIVLIAALSLLAAAVGAYLSTDEDQEPTGPTLNEMADAVGTPLMTRVVRGHVPRRSGDIMLVPRPHVYMAVPWDMTTWGSDNPLTFTSHATGWGYLDHVPLVLYGPRHVPSGRIDEEVVDAASVAPTYASLVGLEDFEADAPPLTGIGKSGRPRAIVTVIIDGGGWNVLRSAPEDWPTLKELSQKGTTFLNASVGTMPSVTGPVHTTFGTGRYPARHGVPSNPWLQLSDPTTIRVPTVSERWDEASQNEAIVAGIMYESPHLGMIGVGRGRPKGDADIAALWSDGQEWISNPRFYDLPDYATAPAKARIHRRLEAMDERDGNADGLWFGHEIADLDEENLPGTPTFVEMTGDLTLNVMRNEAIGADSVTDFVWIEFKSPDFAGHLYNMVGPEVGDVLSQVDSELSDIKNALDELVPDRDYVLTVSADHGQQPLADRVNGWPINKVELEKDLQVRFPGVLKKATSVDLELDSEKVAELNITPSDIASWLVAYKISDNIPPGSSGIDRLPDDLLDRPVFAGAFTDEYLRALTPSDLSSFGASSFNEGSSE